MQIFQMIIRGVLSSACKSRDARAWLAALAMIDDVAARRTITSLRIAASNMFGDRELRRAGQYEDIKLYET
jgi:hypothetical protein